jgi:hypothetical protein
MKILESASKIVFILLTLGLIMLTAAKMVEAKDFIMLCGMAFTFYFSNKGNEQNGYLGK